MYKAYYDTNDCKREGSSSAQYMWGEFEKFGIKRGERRTSAYTSDGRRTQPKYIVAVFSYADLERRLQAALTNPTFKLYDPACQMPREDGYSRPAEIVYDKPVIATPFTDPDRQKIMQENIMLKEQNTKLEQTVASMQLQMDRMEKMLAAFMAQQENGKK